MFSGTLNSEAAGFPAGHVPDRISCMSYANEHHVFRLAQFYEQVSAVDINRCLTRAGVSKLWLVGYIQSKACFCK